MKKYKNIFLLLFISALLFAACSEDKLEIPQKGVISIDDFYKTDADAESALVDAYAEFQNDLHGVTNAWIYVPFNIMFNYEADNVLAAGNYYGDNDHLASINEFRYDANSDVVKLMYQRFYFIIYHANLVIDHFQYGESAVKDRCISEARVIRAYAHMYAALAWGTPPLVDHVLGGNDKPANYSGTQQDLLKWCAKECEEAAAFIPERASTTDKNGAVKITKGFAQALQGKALLYAGDYAAAKVALKKVIDSGKYALVPGNRWRDLFHIEGDGCEEKVFELNIYLNNDYSFQVRSTWMEANLWGWRTDKLATQPTSQGIGGWGGLAIEETFADEFYAHDGNSFRRKATMVTYDEFITEIGWADDDVVTTTAEKYTDPKRGIKDPTGLYGQCKFLLYKQIATTADLQAKSWRFNNYNVMRYADVLLMYAEACAQSTDADNSGLKALQDVQTRSGSGMVSSALNLADVKKERNYELFMEGARWIDMKRWGELTKVQNAGKHIPSLKDAFIANENGVAEAQHRGYVTYSEPNAGNVVGFKAGKHELYPYPVSVLRTNPNLVQNPGW